MQVDALQTPLELLPLESLWLIPLVIAQYLFYTCKISNERGGLRGNGFQKNVPVYPGLVGYMVRRLIKVLQTTNTRGTKSNREGGGYRASTWLMLLT